MINAGQDILSDGKERIDTIQSTLPGIEQTYINAMKTARLLPNCEERRCTSR